MWSCVTSPLPDWPFARGLPWGFPGGWRRLRPKRHPGGPGQQGKNPPDGKSADAIKDNQRKTDEFVEAQQAINGPAGNPECVWLGRRVVSLMWLDDLDTAFRHLDLYDRFGCPGGHVQASFRCLTRFGATIDDKVPRSLNDRIHACWINPAAQLQAAAPPARRPLRRRPAARRPPPAPRRGSGGSREVDRSRQRESRPCNAGERCLNRCALKTPWRHTSC